jgi:hypothetical protein
MSAGRKAVSDVNGGQQEGFIAYSKNMFSFSENIASVSCGC